MRPAPPGSVDDGANDVLKTTGELGQRPTHRKRQGQTGQNARLAEYRMVFAGRHPLQHLRAKNPNMVAVATVRGRKLVVVARAEARTTTAAMSSEASGMIIQAAGPK